MNLRKELNDYAQELTKSRFPYHYRKSHDYIDIERIKKISKLHDLTTTITVYADQEPKILETERWYEQDNIGAIGIQVESKSKEKQLSMDDLTKVDKLMIDKVKEYL